MARHVLRRTDGVGGGGALVGPSGRQYEISAEGVVVVESDIDRDALLQVGKPPWCDEARRGEPGIWELVTAEPKAAPAPVPQPQAVLESPTPSPALLQQDTQAIKQFGTTEERQEAVAEVSVVADEVEPDDIAEEEAPIERKAEEAGGTFNIEAEDPQELDPISTTLGYRQCRGKTQKGTRCKRRAQKDSNYCVLHDPEV